MKIVRWTVVLLGAAVFASVTALGNASAGDDQREFAQVRQATAKYHNEARAVKDGYTRTDVCVPGMGYHYINFQLFNEALDEHNPAAPDPLKPPALIYAPNGKDGRKLIGVEYFARADDQVPDLNQNPEYDHNDPIPALFGTNFDGPMTGHFTGMAAHYDLHAYIWTTNPNGTLATQNPEVTCPDESDPEP